MLSSTRDSKFHGGFSHSRVSSEVLSNRSEARWILVRLDRRGVQKRSVTLDCLNANGSVSGSELKCCCTVFGENKLVYFPFPLVTPRSPCRGLQRSPWHVSQSGRALLSLILPKKGKNKKQFRVDLSGTECKERHESTWVFRFGVKWLWHECIMNLVCDDRVFLTLTCTHTLSHKTYIVT